MKALAAAPLLLALDAGCAKTPEVACLKDADETVSNITFNISQVTGDCVRGYFDSTPGTDAGVICFAVENGSVWALEADADAVSDYTDLEFCGLNGATSIACVQTDGHQCVASIPIKD